MAEWPWQSQFPFQRKKGASMSNQAGAFVNNLSGKMAYQCFRLAPLPPGPPIELSNELIAKLIDTNKKLTALDVLSSRSPNMDLFVSMYVHKETLLSSQIEGPNAHWMICSILLSGETPTWMCLILWITSVQQSMRRLQTLPLCNRLIKKTHAVLMEGARTRKESRRVSLFIKLDWRTREHNKSYRYILPNPDDMKTAMSDLEKYMNSDDTLYPLIQASLIHYQFEITHPFWNHLSVIAWRGNPPTVWSQRRLLPQTKGYKRCAWEKATLSNEVEMLRAQLVAHSEKK